MKTITSLFIFFLFIFLFSPALVQNEFSLFTLKQPEHIRYVLWIANFNFFDLVLLCTLFILFVTFPMKIIGSISNIEILCVVIASLSGLFLLLYNGFHINVYFDGLIYTFRFLALYIIIYTLLKLNLINEFKLLFVFLVSGLALVFTSIMAWGFGYSGIMGGRINAFGMGPHVSSIYYIVCIMVLINFTYFNKINLNKFFVMFLFFVLSIGVFLTGSRRSLIYLISIGFIYFVFFKKTTNIKVIVSFLFFLLVILVSIYVIEVLTFLSGLGFSLADRLIFLLSGEESFAEDGRFEMWQQVYSMFLKFPGGIGLSDWLIQSEMGKYGWDSHTHNIILQFYFKYGLAIFFFIPYLLIVLNRFLKKDFLAIVLLLILIDSMGGYIFWNQKAVYLMSGLFSLIFFKHRVLKL
ncbi:oligosaccharide repeat unit polymerase [Shewanella sp. SG44-2]|uniref:O-antigen polymerase n=1 Tax=Shewanella sp. SG44-2 TaxID=2760962 RepID=UPI001600A8BA|nr:O-antigen polymerase [Shewanella sp. SG44-2]MBB1428475.1 oligosaccharide repeat unit polymerase [Shewanella sp. SG44-2]